MPLKDGELVPNLLINLNERVDGLSKEISDLKVVIRKDVSDIAIKVERHEGYFNLIGRVFSWGGASLGLGMIIDLIIKYLNPR